LDPDYFVLLSAGLEGILRLGIRYGEDPNTIPAPVVFYDDGLHENRPAAKAIWSTKASSVYFVVFEQGGSPGLGTFVGLGPHTAGFGPVVTASDLGLSTFTPYTLVLRERSDGNVVVLATADAPGVPSGGESLNASSLFTMYRFVLDPTLAGSAAVVEEASEVDVDAPFIVQQLASGRATGLQGEGLTEKVWAIGNGNFERLARRLVTQEKLGSVFTGDAPATAVVSAGTVVENGVWVCEDESLSRWRLVYTLAAGVADDNFEHSREDGDYAPGGNGFGPSQGPSWLRELGLAYDPAWQRLHPVAVDHDAGQDPFLYVPNRLLQGGGGGGV